MPRGQLGSSMSLEEEFFARAQGRISTPKIFSNRIQNRTFCFTGKLSTMGRKKAWSLVRNHGGQTSRSVTYSVDILVAGEIPRTAIISGELSLKLQEAQRKGTEIISEDSFLQMLRDAGEQI